MIFFDTHLFQVYALTKERDTLRREHNKKNDAAALLKEKDEIITQVMAEGPKNSISGSKSDFNTLHYHFTFVSHEAFLLYIAYKMIIQ